MAQITNSRRCSFGYDQRLEAFGSTAMLSAANQLPTSVRRSDAGATECAAPYLNFFLDRYTPAYRAKLDHFITSVENGTTANPNLRRRTRGAGAGRRRGRVDAYRGVRPSVSVRADAVPGGRSLAAQPGGGAPVDARTTRCGSIRVSGGGRRYPANNAFSVRPA